MESGSALRWGFCGHLNTFFRPENIAIRCNCHESKQTTVYILHEDANFFTATETCRGRMFLKGFWVKSHLKVNCHATLMYAFVALHVWIYVCMHECRWFCMCVYSIYENVCLWSHVGLWDFLLIKNNPIYIIWAIKLFHSREDITSLAYNIIAFFVIFRCICDHFVLDETISNSSKPLGS